MVKGQWESTAGVLLEERVRAAGGFEGREPYGNTLFGQAFVQTGRSATRSIPTPRETGITIFARASMRSSAVTWPTGS